MWTAEQLRAINEDGNLLVSAAAGAGKTAVMTERIARIIASGTDVSEILLNAALPLPMRTLPLCCASRASLLSSA